MRIVANFAPPTVAEHVATLPLPALLKLAQTHQCRVATLQRAPVLNAIQCAQITDSLDALGTIGDELTVRYAATQPRATAVAGYRVVQNGTGWRSQVYPDRAMADMLALRWSNELGRGPLRYHVVSVREAN